MYRNSIIPLYSPFTFLDPRHQVLQLLLYNEVLKYLVTLILFWLASVRFLSRFPSWKWQIACPGLWLPEKKNPHVLSLLLVFLPYCHKNNFLSFLCGGTSFFQMVLTMEGFCPLFYCDSFSSSFQLCDFHIFSVFCVCIFVHYIIGEHVLFEKMIFIQTIKSKTHTLIIYGSIKMATIGQFVASSFSAWKTLVSKKRFQRPLVNSEIALSCKILRQAVANLTALGWILKDNCSRY